MDAKEILGLALVGALVTSVAFGHRKVTIDGEVQAKQETPTLTTVRGDKDADHIITVTPSLSSTAPWTKPVILSERDGLYYSPDGSSYSVSQRPQLAFWDQRWELGGFAGGRASGPTAGIRVSPLRLGYGCLAPDLAVGPNWVGGGVSVYAPETLVSPRWTRIGLGAWYGYPTFKLSGHDMDRPGWTIGISFSTR